MSVIETIIDIPAEHEKNVCGQFDSYLKKIERTLHVTIVARDGAIKLIGPELMIRRAKSVFNNLVELSKRGNAITEQNVDYALSLCFTESDDAILEIDKDIICRTINGKPVKPKTVGQKQYVDTIRKKMIVFGIGPAGTGKTYLAMAMAISAFKNGDVNRIILIRPLYDALYQIMGAESFLHNQEKGLIEVAPLAYMRGRTLDNAYIILDEAQNTTPAQMKMFLTRFGFGSKMVITGDITQIDLPNGKNSGLKQAAYVLQKTPGVGIIRFGEADVVRHEIVAAIIRAYENYDSRRQKQREADNDNNAGK